jgi:hypothetical protein
MSHQAFLEYIKAVGTTYVGAAKGKKTQILSHAKDVTGKDRKTLIRYLSRKTLELEQQRGFDGRGRPVEYDPTILLPHIKTLWRLMERISPERMKAGLKDWLPAYEHPDFTPAIRIQLELMSIGTLGRMIATLRQKDAVNKGLSTTSSGLRRMKNCIPINTLDYKVEKPGFTQADTVSHCGSSAAGPFLSTVTLTDIVSTWTENRAIPSKKGIEVRDAFTDIKKSLPFPLLAINTDSGTEFLNNPVIHFMTSFYGQKPITFTRSRPYRKNDNAYVEQKNYTHVRQLFGYERLEDESLVPLMNEIYKEYWNPLQNFFLPSQKLQEKIRVGSKIMKKMDKPQTAYDRLMSSSHISDAQKVSLAARKAELNPIELAKGLETKLAYYYEILRRLRTQKEVA